MARSRNPVPPTPTDASPSTDEDAALYDLGLELPDDEEGYEEPAPPVRSLGANIAELGDVVLSFPEDKHPAAADVAKFKRMIWMARKKGSFRAIVNEGDGETRGIVKVNTEPFCLTPPIHPHFYDQFVKDHIPKAPNGADGGLRVPKWQRLWETPPEQAMLPRRNRLGQIIPKKDEHGRPVLGVDGKPVPVMELQSDCRGLATYMEKIEGKPTGHVIKTCPLANCPSHPRPEGIHHSVWQAHKFISLMRNVSAIRRYVREYDPRPDVASFAQRVIDRRIAIEEKERGLGTTNIDLAY